MHTSDTDPVLREQPSSAPPSPHDVWADGAAYEPYIGRWSRLVARAFLAWLAVVPNSRWLMSAVGRVP